MLTTLATVKTEIGVSGSDDDAFLTTLIEQASASIESYCCRAFGLSVQTETHRLGIRRAAIILDRIPVTEVAAVVEDGVTLTSSDYEYKAEEGLLYRLSSDDLAVWTARKVVVTYTAGYADTPADVERCCIDLVKLAYYARSRDPLLRSEKVLDVIDASWTVAAGASVGGLPADVAQRLDRYRVVAVA